jgi:hypothetical protein
MRKLILLAIPALLLLSGCGGHHDDVAYYQGNPNYSEIRTDYNSSGSRPVDASFSPFGSIPMNDHVTVRTG